MRESGSGREPMAISEGDIRGHVQRGQEVLDFLDGRGEVSIAKQQIRSPGM